MNADKDPLRRHLVRALEWGEAHLTLEESLKGLAAAGRGKRPRGFAHSPWELLEHIRLAQRDLLDFCRDPRYEEGDWPADYWPPTPAPPSRRAWAASLKAVAADRRAFQEFVRTAPDLFAEIPGHPGKTILRSVLLAIDHTSYHVGQLLMARKILGA
ncbi:MAG TPA: DinB family protein [Thermoanaerobaculia bacterium]|nr:DinB family protein [Thermoanaerobaculia bacterium]